MSTNLSKQKWDDLFSKISTIQTYIATAPEAENIGNLFTYKKLLCFCELYYAHSNRCKAAVLQSAKILIK